MQQVYLPARTGETARCVYTNIFAATIVHETFIYILAMRFVSCLLITVVAYALISAHHVLADSIGTYTTCSRTLIDILARILVRTQLVSWWTLTFESTFGIHTGTTSAQTLSLLAFVYV